MAAIEFALDVTLDSEPYPAARGDLGQRQVAVEYVPKIKATNRNAIGQAELDPLELTTWHRGSGASRAIGIDGMIAYAENLWMVDPGVLLPGPAVTAVALTGATVAPRPDGISEADGHIFVAAGRYVFRLTAGQAIAPTPSQDLDLTGTNVGMSIKRFGTSLFLSQVTSAAVGLNLYERPDGGVWASALLGATAVQPTGALGTVFWTTGAAGSEITVERLVAQFGPRRIRYCSASPRLDTSWTPGLASPAIDVGAILTRFVTTLAHLYLATTSGLRDLDSSGLAPNLIPEAEVGVIPQGGLAALARSGWAFCSAGYDLFMVNVSGNNGYAKAIPVTPMALLPNETPVAGYGTALLARGKYLIYAQYDPVLDTTWISWGREVDSSSAEGSLVGSNMARNAELGPIVWNVAPIVLHGFKVTALHISGLATDGPRLWMFGETAAHAVSARWAPLAYTTPYADLKAGRGRGFAASGFAIMPAEDGGEDSVPKDIEEVLHDGENLTAGNSVTVSAAKEGESSYTQLARYTSGPRVVQQVPTAFVTQRPTIRIDMAGSAASPPITRRLSVRWLPNPDTREVRRYLFQLGRDERFGSGNRVARGADEQAAALVALATSAARIGFIDEVGNNLMVRVLKVDGPAEVQAGVDGDRSLTIAVTLSIFGAAPGAPFNWDSNTPWDSNHSWS